MLFNAKYLTLAALFTVVAAQQPPQCVLACSQAAIGSATNTSCTSISDPCVCDDQGFLTADGTCLQANCTAAEQATAAQLAKALCGGDNSTTTDSTSASASSSMSTAGPSTMSISGSMTTMSGSGSMSSMVMPSSSTSGSKSSSAASSTASAKNGAGAQAEFGFVPLIISAAGAVVGGMLL